MATWLIPGMAGAPGAANTIAASSTRFIRLTTNGGRAQGTTVEADNQVLVTTAKVLQSVRVYIYINNATGPMTIITRKNGADGGLSATVNAGVTGYIDLTGTPDTLAVNDLVCLKLVTGSGGTTSFTTIRTICLMDECVTTMCNGGVLGTALASTGKVYTALGGDARTDPAEANINGRSATAFTLRNLQARCAANTWTGLITVKSRIAGAYGNLVATFSAGSGAATASDTTHSDAVVFQNQLDFEIELQAGTGSFTFVSVTCELVTTNGEIICLCGVINELPGTNINVWSCLSNNSTISDNQSGPPTEVEQQMSLGVPAIITSIFSQAVTNAQAGMITTSLHINGSGGPSMTRNAGVTGFSNNPVNFPIKATDVLAWDGVYSDNNTIAWTMIAGAVIRLVQAGGSMPLLGCG